MSDHFKITHHFQPPDSNNEIETMPFLLASQEVLVLIDFLGPNFLKSAFHRTRNDISGNITTIKTKYETDPIKYATLHKMLDDEIITQDYTATISLLWLKRGLEFVYHFSKSTVQDNEQNLCNITLQAYELSLKRFHAFYVRGLFYLVAHILPYRRDFLKLLGGNVRSEEEVLAELECFVKQLAPNLDILNGKFIQLGRNEEC